MRLRLMLPAVFAFTTLFGAQTFAAPVVVACGPGRHTLVRHTFDRGRPVTRVECVRGGRVYSAYQGRHATRYRVRHPHRSWGKTALVIGGSAATGAGVGGIVHGGKGALIGSGIAGGAASLYESAHRR